MISSKVRPSRLNRFAKEGNLSPQRQASDTNGTDHYGRYEAGTTPIVDDHGCDEMYHDDADDDPNVPAHPTDTDRTHNTVSLGENTQDSRPPGEFKVLPPVPAGSSDFDPVGVPRSGPDGFSDTDLDVDDLAAGPHILISPLDSGQDSHPPGDHKVPPSVSSGSTGVDPFKVDPVRPDGNNDEHDDDDAIPPRMDKDDLLPPIAISDGESDDDDLNGNDSDDDDPDDNDVLPPLAGDFDSDLEDLLCLHDAGTSVYWPPGLSEKEVRRLQRTAGDCNDKTDTALGKVSGLTPPHLAPKLHFSPPPPLRPKLLQPQQLSAARPRRRHRHR